MLIKQDSEKGFKSDIFKMQQRIQIKSKQMLKKIEKLDKEIPENRIQLNNIYTEINAINSFYESKGKSDINNI